MNTGLCKVCNTGATEDVNHFMFACNRYSEIRNDVFKNLKDELETNGWGAMWVVFTSGDSQIKRHLLLDNIFKDNNDLGKYFDVYCKKYLVRAWNERLEFYNVNKL